MTPMARCCPVPMVPVLSMACPPVLLIIVSGVLSSPSMSVEEAPEDITVWSPVASEPVPPSAPAAHSSDGERLASVIERAAVDVGALAARRVLSNPSDDVAWAETGRRRESPWDSAAPALLIGGTVAALMLAAVGALAGKALLASILAATISAMQLARPPPRRGK